jgi:hypothetical protein
MSGGFVDDEQGVVKVNDIHICYFTPMEFSLPDSLPDKAHPGCGWL